MKLRILENGVYNDRQHRARRCAKDEVFDTSAGYGQSLIDSGYACRASAVNAEPAAPDFAESTIDASAPEIPFDEGDSESEAEAPVPAIPSRRRRSASR